MLLSLLENAVLEQLCTIESDRTELDCSVELDLLDRSSCGAKRSQYAVSERGILSTI